MEETQGRLSEGAGTGLPDLAASPVVCAHAPEQAAMPQAESLGEFTAEMEALGSPNSADRDLECLVCCHRYSFDRLPKVLTCQHTFCVVCLKLLLTIREDSWMIICPLCRMATSVPGGLICNLRNQAEVMGRLVVLGPEVQLSPQQLAQPTGGRVASMMDEDSEDSASANRVAARRLGVLLGLLVLLIFLILPFVYPGMIRWVLIFIMCLALLLSSIFCCLPGSRGCCSPTKTLLPGQRKHSHVASIA
ncbi:E3 ubiquitin-protein ligase RNF186 [Trichosurus vulpecula]|uniref:E3 ubiquitin-protein ligase RNF186 n=1 Tax=Trichosurus vulpecula TaxID=9337 RepID=UPI00186B389A|nr:E3 ubiquitin-protein ligase RNF186 [Trichosurus vulpecula]